MFFEEPKINGLREFRFVDKRLALLPHQESRFRAAAHLVEFFAQKSKAIVLSWCVEGEEVIVLAQGGDASVEIPMVRSEPHCKRALLEAAQQEEQRAREYKQAHSDATDPDTALGYLDLASEAMAAARTLTEKASALD